MRFPLFPTLLAGAAIAVMIGLGIWQIGRIGEKKALLARLEAALTLPETAWPAVPPADDRLLFRRAAGYCVRVTGWRAVAGRSLRDEAGWSHIAACATGGMEGPGMQADVGWSRSSDNPRWRGGLVRGIVASDRKHRIRLVATTPVPGLALSAPPSTDTIPNNHLFYAVQWFFFAFAAAVIYVLALRRRQIQAAKLAGEADSA